MLKRFVVLFTLLAGCQVATAEVIVDTGNSYCVGGVGTSCGGNTVYRYSTSYQSLAAQFSLSSDAVLSGVEGWMNTFGSIGDTLTIAIYGDAGQVPDMGNELYSQAFSIYAPDFQDDYGNAWQGLSGLDWALSAGDYWISFEVRSGQDYWGYMPTFEWGAPNPLADEAFQSSYNGGTWLEYDGMNIGLHIEGVYAVPVPPTALLLLTGFLGLLISRRRS